MKVCATCGCAYPDEHRSCPACARRMGSLLSHKLTPDQGAVGVTMEVLRSMQSRWGMGSFATGWRLVDLLGRIVLILVLVALVVAAPPRIEEETEQAHARLAGYRRQGQEFRALRRPPTSEEIGQLMINYERLEASSQELLDAHVRNSWLNLVVLLLILMLLVSSVVGKYRGHKDMNRVKAAFTFLCSPEGEPFLRQLQKQETERRRIATPPRGSPSPGGG